MNELFAWLIVTNSFLTTISTEKQPLSKSVYRIIELFLIFIVQNHLKIVLYADWFFLKARIYFINY